MTRGSLGLALVAVLLTLFSGYLALRQRDLRESRARERALFEVAPEQVDGFDLYRGDDVEAQASFRRDMHGNWQVTIPSRMLTDTADPKAVQELVALVAIASLRPVQEVTAEEAGLTDPATRVMLVVRSDDDIEETLVIGATSPGGHLRYVARGDDPDRVHAVGADYLYVVDRKPIDYRSLQLFDLHRGELEAITLDPGGEREATAVEIRREPEGWFLTSPVRWPADDKRLADLVRQLQALRAQSVVADKVGDPGVFGLTPSASRIELLVGGQTQEVRFGRLAGQPEGVHAKRRSRDAVYIVSRSLAEHLAIGLRDKAWPDWYRRRELFLLQDVEPATLFLQNPNGTALVLSRSQAASEQEAATWSASGTRRWGVQPETVAAYVQQLRSLRVKSFASETQDNLERFGLATPLRRIVCTDPASRQLLGLSIGLSEDKERGFVTIDGLPQVFELYRDALKNLLASEVFFRSRQVTDFDYKSIRSVTIENDAGKREYRWVTGGEFQVAHPVTAPLTEGGLRFAGILNYLGQLPCIDWVAENADDLSRFGLDQPRIRVLVTLRFPAGEAAEDDAPALDLRVGDPVSGDPRDREGDAYACLGGTSDVFIVSGSLVKELQKEFK